MSAVPSPTAPVTQHDLAASLGLNQATVSRCFSAPERVDEDTRKRVMQKVEELGYRPNWRGRALRERRTRMIGLVSTSESRTFAYLNPQVLTALIAGLHARQYQLVHVRVEADASETPSLTDARFDGCLIDHHVRDVELDAIREAGLPAVLINAKPLRGLPSVRPDHEEAGRLVAAAVAASNRPSAVFFPGFFPLGEPKYPVSEWIRGLRAGFRQAGLTRAFHAIKLAPADTPGGLGTPERHLIAALRALAAKGPLPTLVAESAFQATRTFLPCCRAAGIPLDGVRVVSMVDGPELDAIERAVPAVAIPFAEMGALAVELLLAAVEGGPAVANKPLTVRLVERAAAGPTATAGVRAAMESPAP